MGRRSTICRRTSAPSGSCSRITRCFPTCLGASRLYTFRRVTLPLIRPGILAGGFIAFMASFANVPVSLFPRDARTDMLPIRMWQDLEGKLDVSIAAVSGVMIVATLSLMILMERLSGLSRRLR